MNVYEPDVEVRTEAGVPGPRAVQIIAVRDPAMVTDESLFLGTLKLVAVTGLLVIAIFFSVFVIPVAALIACLYAWVRIERGRRRRDEALRRINAR